MKYLIIVLCVAGMGWLVKNTVFLSEEEKGVLVLIQLANEQLHISSEYAWQLVGSNGNVNDVKKMADTAFFYPVDSIYYLDTMINGKIPYVLTFKNRD